MENKKNALISLVLILATYSFYQFILFIEDLKQKHLLSRGPTYNTCTKTSNSSLKYGWMNLDFDSIGSSNDPILPNTIFYKQGRKVRSVLFDDVQPIVKYREVRRDLTGLHDSIIFESSYHVFPFKNSNKFKSGHHLTKKYYKGSTIVKTLISFENDTVPLALKFLGRNDSLFFKNK